MPRVFTERRNSASRRSRSVALARSSLQVENLEQRLAPDAASISPELGIAADAIIHRGPHLTGDGVHLGQVDQRRPGIQPPDDNAHSHPNVKPARVYDVVTVVGANEANTNVSSHAISVAGVMIADGNPQSPGVARKASLHASAHGSARHSRWGV